MSWTHLNDTKPKARKDHTCTLCGRPIPRGQIHIARRGIDEGPLTIRMHIACEAETKDWDQCDWEAREEGDLEEHMDKLSASNPPEQKR